MKTYFGRLCVMCYFIYAFRIDKEIKIFPESSCHVNGKVCSVDFQDNRKQNKSQEATTQVQLVSFESRFNFRGNILSIHHLKFTRCILITNLYQFIEFCQYRRVELHIYYQSSKHQGNFQSRIYHYQDIPDLSPHSPITAQETPEYDLVFYRIGIDYFHIQAYEYLYGNLRDHIRVSFGQ